MAAGFFGMEPGVTGGLISQWEVCQLLQFEARSGGEQVGV